ncbi:hypothetical protein J6590_026958 [Homalodisca vitripennis]|nr:hypothetical protein J6590_026958 [Homalodisca vitripennis]
MAASGLVTALETVARSTVLDGCLMRPLVADFQIHNLRLGRCREQQLQEAWNCLELRVASLSTATVLVKLSSRRGAAPNTARPGLGS